MCKKYKKHPEWERGILPICNIDISIAIRGLLGNCRVAAPLTCSLYLPQAALAVATLLAVPAAQVKFLPPNEIKKHPEWDAFLFGGERGI